MLQQIFSNENFINGLNNPKYDLIDATPLEITKYILKFIEHLI